MPPDVRLAPMSTAPPVARAYDALRPKILERLLDMRSTLDPSLARADESTARTQLGAVLDHLGNFIATGDLGLHRAFLHTFLAMRAAEAQGPAAVLAMLVAIGDTAGGGATGDRPRNTGPPPPPPPPPPGPAPPAHTPA